MEVQEAQKRKQELQRAIARLITEFESQTGFHVEQVDVERLSYQYSGESKANSKLARVTVEARL